MKYTVFLSEHANIDLDDLEFVIKHEYKSPQTAFSYVQGLKNEIKKLELFAEIYPVRYETFYQQFGIEIRRINYKKMAVIYSVHSDFVYIHRIMAAALITDWKAVGKELRIKN